MIRTFFPSSIWYSAFALSLGSATATAAAQVAVPSVALPEVSKASSSDTTNRLASGAQVLIQGPVPASSITTQDVLADVQQRVPPEARSQVLSGAGAVSQIATNLYVRRAMAAQAEAAGMGNDADTVAALRLARDRVLSDAWLAKIDAQHQLSDEVAERLARDTYKAQPDRFKAREQVRARHILVSGTTPESRAKAEKLLDDLKAGADFAALAKENSADTRSAAKGGDLGFFERDRMVPQFEEAAFALTTPGQLSGVIETQFGFHIIKFEERKAAGMRPFEEVRAALMTEVRNTVQQEARVNEAQRLQKDMQVQQEAVASFVKSFPSAQVNTAR